MAQHMLTTWDNPWNPFTHYREWEAYDRMQGHHTNSLLARLVVTSDDLPESVQEQAIEDAIDLVVNEPVLALTWRKVASDLPMTFVQPT